MKPFPFILITSASRGLSLALARHYLRTTDLPVFATHRSNNIVEIQHRILRGEDLKDVDPGRLHLLRLELTSEDSIAAAARCLAHTLRVDHDTDPGSAYIHTAFFTGGILHPERQPADLDAQQVLDTFKTNVVSHLLLIKHFSQFLPSAQTSQNLNTNELSKWVHVSARVGSVSDNRLGGWYSYRASKAALNQVVRTFDLHLAVKKTPAICVGVHPGTVKTDLSKDFWATVKEGKLFEPQYAAEQLAKIVGDLKTDQRGRIWDWAGKEICP